MRVRKSAVLVLVTLIGGGCGGPAAYQPIPVDDARALNTRVSVFYNETRELLEESAYQASTVGSLSADIRPQDFELELVRSALMACFNTPLAVTEVTIDAPRGVTAEVGDDPLRPLTVREDLGTVRACDPAELISLESYLDVAPDNINAFITERLLSVDSMRVNLKHVLQERLNILEEQTLDTRGQVAQLRDTSRERYESTMGNDEVSEEQRRQTEADYEVIQSQFDEIERLVDSIDTDLTELRRFRRQVVEDVAVQVAAMGTPRS